MTCNKNVRTKTARSVKIMNFTKKLLVKLASSKKHFSIVSIDLGNGKAIWALAFAIMMLAGSIVYATNTGIRLEVTNLDTSVSTVRK